MKIKHAALALSAAMVLGATQTFALTPYVPDRPETAPNPNIIPPEATVPGPETWTTPTVESCLNLPMYMMERTPGCHVLLKLKSMQEADITTMEVCFVKSAEARDADARCKALWAKFPDIVKLRKPTAPQSSVL